MTEVISTPIDRADPERMPSLQGFGPIAGPPRPLVDDAGRSLLPRIVKALRAGLTVPSPASQVQNRTRSVLDAGDKHPGIDPELLAAAQLRARRLHDQVTGDLLGQAIADAGHALVTAFAVPARILDRWLGRIFRPAPKALKAGELGPYGRRGVLDVPPDFEERRAQFYGRGL